MRSAIAFTVLLCAMATAAPVPKALKKNTLTVVIDADGGVTVRGVALKADAKRDQLFDILGKPDRTSPGSNIRHTWDQLGITALYNSSSHQLAEFSVVWKPDSELEPKVGFAGEVVLNGVGITAETTVAEINEAGKDKAFRPLNENSNWFERIHPATTVFIHTTAPASDLKSGLKYIAIDPAGR